MAINRFLIIDHNPKTIEQLSLMINGLGFDAIFSTNDQDEAFSIIEKKKIQFLIANISVRNLNCLTFIQKLRGNSKYQFLPIVLYAEKMTDDDIYLLHNLGIDHYLRPPLTNESVLPLIQDRINAENTIDKAETTLRKMEVLFGDGKVSAAIQLYYPKLTDEGPNFLRANTLVGEIYLAIDKLDRAVEFHDKVMQKDPDFSPGIYLGSKIASAKGEHDKATKMLEELVQICPKSLNSLVNLGHAYIDADKLEEAESTFNQVSILDPDAPDLKDGKGKLAYKKGDIEKAKALLGKSSSGLRIARFFNDIAIKFVNHHETSKALKTYDDALDILADQKLHYKIVFNKGLAYAKSGDLVKAFEHFADTYLRNPSFEAAYKNLAIMYKKALAANLEVNGELVQEVKSTRDRHKSDKAS